MKGFSLIAGAFFLSLSTSWAYDLKEVLNRIEKKERSIALLSFDFVQTIDFVGMDLTSESKGNAILSKRGELKISKLDPQKQTTISNGKTVWVYTPDYNQVWEGDAKTWLNKTALPNGMVPLQGYVSGLQKNFSLSLLENTTSTDDLVRLNAVPKNKRLDYTLNLAISTVSWLPVETIFTSESARVITTCSQYKINPNLKPNTFTFNPPKGVDVISLN